MIGLILLSVLSFTIINIKAFNEKQNRNILDIRLNYLSFYIMQTFAAMK